MNITKEIQPDNILDVLSSEELLNICGGSVDHTLSDHLKAITSKFIADSWNTFCSNFNQGYQEHIRK
jgi:hypothetical protein